MDLIMAELTGIALDHVAAVRAPTLHSVIHYILR